MELEIAYPRVLPLVKEIEPHSEPLEVELTDGQFKIVEAENC